MQRWLLALGMVLALAGSTASVNAAATRQRDPIQTQLLIIVARGARLSVFQELTLAHPLGQGRIAVLEGAHRVRMVGGTAIQRGRGTVLVKARGRRIVLRYRVAWNGQSWAGTYPHLGALRAGLVLTEPSLALPGLLNPDLTPIGEGRIPALADSPRFEEYAVGRLRPNQPTPLVVEHVAPLGQPSGVAHLDEGLVGLLMLGALIWALNWKPAQPTPPLYALEKVLDNVARGAVSRAEWRAALLRELGLGETPDR